MRMAWLPARGAVRPVLSAEVILPLRAHAQPSPKHVPLGDCGACVLGGLMSLSVDEAYAFVRNGDPRPIGWQDMRAALDVGEATGRFDRAMTDVPLWPHAVPSMCLTWGLTASWQSRAWWGYVTTAMDAGLYGLACVSSKGAGSDSEGPDHWVLIVGYREWSEVTDSGSTLIHTELLVSCSARHPEGQWVSRNDFLRRWGGFNTLWARPAP